MRNGVCPRIKAARPAVQDCSAYYGKYKKGKYPYRKYKKYGKYGKYGY